MKCHILIAWPRFNKSGLISWSFLSTSSTTIFVEIFVNFFLFSYLCMCPHVPSYSHHSGLTTAIHLKLSHPLWQLQFLAHTLKLVNIWLGHLSMVPLYNCDIHLPSLKVDLEYLLAYSTPLVAKLPLSPYFFYYWALYSSSIHLTS